MIVIVLLPTHQWIVFCIETITSLTCITQLQIIYKNWENKKRSEVINLFLEFQNYKKIYKITKTKLILQPLNIFGVWLSMLEKCYKYNDLNKLTS